MRSTSQGRKLNTNTIKQQQTPSRPPPPQAEPPAAPPTPPTITRTDLVEHHLADDGVRLALLHIEHLAQRREAEGFVMRGVREQVRPQRFRLCGSFNEQGTTKLT